MSIDRIGDLVQQARSRATSGVDAAPGSERERLLKVAQEFESMLMLQMLKEMRKAGAWTDDDEKGGFGAQTMLETIDVELAGHLARVQGLGLGKQLLDALEQMHPEGGKPGGSQEHNQRHDLPAGGVGRSEPARDRSSGEGGRVLSFGPGDVTSGFGWRVDPFHGAARFHRGIDIRAAYGQDIPAAGAGRVVSAGFDGGYGQTVVIEHADGVRTRYAHLSAIAVAAGDEVRDGQVVGQAGRSGRATGTHLHFEVTTARGEPLNPEQFARLKAVTAAADSISGNNRAGGAHDVVR